MFSVRFAYAELESLQIFDLFSFPALWDTSCYPGLIFKFGYRLLFSAVTHNEFMVYAVVYHFNEFTFLVSHVFCVDSRFPLYKLLMISLFPAPSQLVSVVDICSVFSDSFQFLNTVILDCDKSVAINLEDVSFTSQTRWRFNDFCQSAANRFLCSECMCSAEQNLINFEMFSAYRQFS